MCTRAPLGVSISVLVVLAAFSTAGAAEYYVSTSGLATNNGSINSPWNIAKAFDGTAGVAAGDTVWIRGGTYVGSNVFYPRFTGTSAQPIKVRAYPGERAILKGNTVWNQLETLQLMYCNYTWFWGLEITSSVTNRVSTDYAHPYSWPTDIDIAGGMATGTGNNGNKLINVIMHDTAGGIGGQNGSLNFEATGCLIYFIGWQGPDRGHGHGNYSQNNTGTKLYQHNIIFGNYGNGTQCYGTDSAYVNNITETRNIFFDNGILATNSRSAELIMGGGNPSENVNVTYNKMYRRMGGIGFEMGDPAIVFMGLQNISGTAENNYMVCGTRIWDFQNNGLTFRYNTIIAPMCNIWLDSVDVGAVPTYTWNFNTYYCSETPDPYGSWQPFWQTYGGTTLRTWAQWRTALGYDANSTYTNAYPTTTVSFVDANPYETGRGNIAVFNWADSNTVSVDVSSVLSNGATYVVKDAQNYFGDPVASGTYNGGSITIPMTSTVVAQPAGNPPAAYVHTSKQFGAFVITSGDANTPTNVAPYVEAGSDAVITWPTSTASLDATISDDGRPNPPASVTTTWSKDSGPGTVTFANANATDTTATFSTAGTYVLRLTATDSSLQSYDTLTLTVRPPVGAAFVESSGLVSIEAENYHYSYAGSGTYFDHSWAVATDKTGYSGASAMRAMPSNTTNAGNTTSGPRMEYSVSFASTGTHYIWLRILGPDTNDNSIHAGLDGNAASLRGMGMEDPNASNAWYWTKLADGTAVSVNVPSTGTHTVGVWMREDGCYVDKVVLTTDANYVPTGTGPAESARVGANAAPTVDAGSNQTTNWGSSHTASLAGTVSDDGQPGGSSVTVTWTKDSGPGTVTFSNANAASTTATFTAIGSYVLRLTATDTALQASDTVTILVNSAPTVDAGTDEFIALPTNTVSLSASQSDDGLPASTTTCTWTKDSGAGTVTFADANAANTAATFSTSGTYVLRATVSDTVLTAYDTVTVTVDPANAAPTAAAGNDQTITLPTNSLSLDGTVSDDGWPRGSSLTTTWTKQSGPGTVTFGSASAVDTTATFTSAGTYVLRLTASDSALQAYDECTITVNPGQGPYGGTAWALPCRIQAEDYDIGGSNVAYYDTTAGNSDAIYRSDDVDIRTTTDTGGGYIIKQVAAGEWLEYTVSVPSTGYYNISVRTATANNGCYFHINLDGNNVTGQINVPNTGGYDAGATTTVLNCYLNSGTRVIRVCFDTGLFNLNWFEVAYPNIAPTVSAGNDQTIVLPETASLAGSVSDDALPNPPAAVSKTWSKDSGPGTVTFGDANAASTTATFSTRGTYVLRLTANDSGLAAYDTMTVTVKSEGSLFSDTFSSDPNSNGWAESVAGSAGSITSNGSQAVLSTTADGSTDLCITRTLNATGWSELELEVTAYQTAGVGYEESGTASTDWLMVEVNYGSGWEPLYVDYGQFNGGANPADVYGNGTGGPALSTGAIVLDAAADNNSSLQVRLTGHVSGSVEDYYFDFFEATGIN